MGHRADAPELILKEGVDFPQVEKGNSLVWGTACVKTRGGKDLLCLGYSVTEQRMLEGLVERK